MSWRSCGVMVASLRSRHAGPRTQKMDSMAEWRKDGAGRPPCGARPQEGSGQRNPLRTQQIFEFVPRQIIVFLLPPPRQRIEPGELGIDLSRVAHDHATVRQ